MKKFRCRIKCCHLTALRMLFCAVRLNYETMVRAPPTIIKLEGYPDYVSR
jgi:hypothetical protein